jgi:hypothetical protein
MDFHIGKAYGESHTKGPHLSYQDTLSKVAQNNEVSLYITKHLSYMIYKLLHTLGSKCQIEEGLYNLKIYK